MKAKKNESITCEQDKPCIRIHYFTLLLLEPDCFQVFLITLEKARPKE